MNKLLLITLLITLPITLLITACYGTTDALGQEGNDTQLGDDGGGDTGGDEAGEPGPIEDHGIAQYCVDRWVGNAEISESLSAMVRAELVSEHERWWSPPTRSYQGFLDISDKPSPMIVPPMCGVADPLWGEAWQTPGSSCLVSGYHMQLPDLVSKPDAGAVQFPYSETILTSTIGNPPEAGRHTWMAEKCCSQPPLPQELDLWMLHQDQRDLVLGSKDADCAMHVWSKGVHDEAGGYPSSRNPVSRIDSAAVYSMCVSNHGIFAPHALTPFKAAGLGTWLPFHMTVKQHTVPVNLNYDWVASWGLIEFKDFAGFGATIDGLVQALLSVLYVPPPGFKHARYGGGSGCFYSASLMYTVGEWQARITCPYGYYEVLPDFDGGDLETRIDGVVGHCAIDGTGFDEGLGDGGGPILSFEDLGLEHFYRVHDVDALAQMLDAVGSQGGKVTAQLQATVLEQDGSPALEDGDKLAWWSHPGDELLAGEDMRRTLGYDVEEFATLMGWSIDEAERFADGANPVPLDKLISDLPAEWASRPANTLRAGNTWTLRVERGTKVMFFYFQ